MLHRRPKRNQKQVTGAPSRWLSSSTHRKPHAAHGTGIKIFPRVDIITPRGAFAQQVVPTPSSSAPTASIEPSVVSSPQKTSNITAPDRRTLQLQAWVEKTVPSLVQPFMDLLANSRNLQQIDRVGPFCSCGPHARRINVTALSSSPCTFNPSVDAHLPRTCSQVAIFLQVLCGPTFAIDLKMLSFMHELHVRSSPNVAAWSSALEEFLSTQGFAISSTDRLRRKVASCLRWYRFLNATKDMLVDQFIHSTSSLVADVADRASGESQANDNTGPSTARVDHVTCAEEDEEDESQWVDDDGPSDVRASRYLQDCCALCFGGDVCSEPQLLTDVIVALDANFQQKRRRPGAGSAAGASFAHPNTSFLSAEEVKLAKDHVEQCRPGSFNEQPLARVSKNAGKKAIDSIITLISLRDSLKEELAALDQHLVVAADSSDIPLDDLVAARESIATKLASLNASLTASQTVLT
ncbi:hypothetical protein BKA70DRAFT_1450531 [Coprinopsis sp. MPI-PUGE-AT-0042]|nr:hypothetical protein BKA70DRAFT_1450531 [Coprinopsis sp. MPI-PUGE-AT-0042]